MLQTASFQKPRSLEGCHHRREGGLRSGGRRCGVWSQSPVQHLRTRCKTHGHCVEYRLHLHDTLRLTSQAPPQVPQHLYRANPHYLRNPNFCVACFKLIKSTPKPGIQPFRCGLLQGRGRGRGDCPHIKHRLEPPAAHTHRTMAPTPPAIFLHTVKCFGCSASLMRGTVTLPQRVGVLIHEGARGRWHRGGGGEHRTVPVFWLQPPSNGSVQAQAQSPLPPH